MAGNDNQSLFIDMPMREGKEGYIGMLYNIQIKFAAILASDSFAKTDMRPLYLTHFLISMIPDEKIRGELRKNLNSDIEQKINNVVSNEDRVRIQNLVCIEHVGKVMEFIDQHVGISMKLDIGQS